MGPGRLCPWLTVPFRGQEAECRHSRTHPAPIPNNISFSCCVSSTELQYVQRIGGQILVVRMFYIEQNLSVTTVGQIVKFEFWFSMRSLLMIGRYCLSFTLLLCDFEQNLVIPGSILLYSFLTRRTSPLHEWQEKAKQECFWLGWLVGLAWLNSWMDWIDWKSFANRKLTNAHFWNWVFRSTNHLPSEWLFLFIHLSFFSFDVQMSSQHLPSPFVGGKISVGIFRCFFHSCRLFFCTLMIFKIYLFEMQDFVIGVF